MHLFMQPLQLPPPSPSLARWLTNTAVPSSVQSAVVAASSIPVPPNQGMKVWCYISIKVHLVACFEHICSSQWLI
jgi:hypothetical protein